MDEIEEVIVEADEIADPGLVPVNEPNPYAYDEAKLTLKQDAVQRLMESFGFTEEMACAVVGI